MDKDEKKDKGYKILVDRKPYRHEESTITGAQIKVIAGVDAGTYEAWLDVPGPEDQQLADTDVVDLTACGVERFFTGKKTTTEGYR